jgi:cytosine/adenosine deaminase-related metal-dependent hydrolase
MPPPPPPARPRTFTVHASVLFDPKKKAFVEHVSLEIDPARGAIAAVHRRGKDEEVILRRGDVDLRGEGRVVIPGLVDAHTHVFLHGYE